MSYAKQYESWEEVKKLKKNLESGGHRFTVRHSKTAACASVSRRNPVNLELQYASVYWHCKFGGKFIPKPKKPGKLTRDRR